MKKDSIVLIGFMGCGKSTIGIRLSYRLRCTVEDTDKIIEAKQGISIKELFATKGEAVFRQLETELLKEMKNTQSKRIISVGGGTPVKEENRELLKQLGTVIYLRIRPETVCKRLKNDKVRPLLQGDNPQEKIASLMAQRKDAYESCADMIIDVDDLEPEEILNKITESIGN